MSYSGTRIKRDAGACDGTVELYVAYRNVGTASTATDGITSTRLQDFLEALKQRQRHVSIQWWDILDGLLLRTSAKPGLYLSLHAWLSACR